MMKNPAIQREIRYEQKKQKPNVFLEFIDGEQFDKLLGKVTNTLFKAIVLLGLPYFIYVLAQLFLMN